MTHLSAPIPSTDSGPGLSQRLDNVGWAIFLILTGIIWLFPEADVPPGTWFIATGILILGLSATRAMLDLPVSGFMTLLGALAVIAGFAALWGMELPLVAIALILLGAALLARQVFGV